MYGKSYDANTGVVGAALRPPGLDAVVAQAIAPDRYRGSYNDRVRFLQSLAYPSVSYGSGGEGGVLRCRASPRRSPTASPTAPTARCRSPSTTSTTRRARSGGSATSSSAPQGSTIPTFVTAGYLDVNTNIGAGAIDFFNALAGPSACGSAGGTTSAATTASATLRPPAARGSSTRSRRFLEHHVRGVPRDQLPPTPTRPSRPRAATGPGASEQQFPPADASALTLPLRPGTYADDATNNGSGDSGAGPGGSGSLGSTRYGHGVWTFSDPLTADTQIVGIPTATVTVVPVVPRTNLVVNVYDVDPEAGTATMLTRGAAMVDAAGEETLTLFPTDWVVPAGHRIGVLVSGANAEAYVHVPTQTTVAVAAGRVTLDVLPAPRVPDLDGGSAARLDAYLQNAPFDIEVPA